MRRLAIHSALALTLVALGWAAGRAQSRSGDFELAIDGEVGTTRIECIRGCTLLGSRDITLAAKPPKATYTFACSGPNQPRCAAQVHGFVAR